MGPSQEFPPYGTRKGDPRRDPRDDAGLAAGEKRGPTASGVGWAGRPTQATYGWGDRTPPLAVSTDPL